MERDLTDRERDILALFAASDLPGVEAVRESLPHLRVIRRCRCECRSIDLRDARRPFADLVRESWATARSRSTGREVVLRIGADGRPTALDLDARDDGPAPLVDLPDPAELVVRRG